MTTNQGIDSYSRSSWHDVMLLRRTSAWYLKSPSSISTPPHFWHLLVINTYNNNPSLGAVVVVVDYLNSASIWHILFFFICSQRTIMLNALCSNVMKSFYSNNIKGDRSSLVLVILRRRTRRKRRRTKRRCSFF